MVRKDNYPFVTYHATGDENLIKIKQLRGKVRIRSKSSTGMNVEEEYTQIRERRR